MVVVVVLMLVGVVGMEGIKGLERGGSEGVEVISPTYHHSDRHPTVCNLSIYSTVDFLITFLNEYQIQISFQHQNLIKLFLTVQYS